MVNRGFARLFRVDLSESAALPEDYPSLSAFFVRELRPGLRPFPSNVATPGSPVDGIVGAIGPLRAGVAVQAKGIEYQVSALLGEGPASERFQSGLFVTIYLSPRHYHRVHAPVSAALHQARSIPGRLFPVGPRSVASVSSLFPRNERLVALMKSGEVDLALVAVGAFNVGRISAAFDPAWNGPDARGATNRGNRRDPATRQYDPPLAVTAGQELMAFHLGSTVVLLVGSKRELPALAIAPGQEVRVGSALLAGPLH